ncbi:MAG: alpha/beta hydrolase-fold protein [Pseudomonadota bacterium]
MMMTLLASMLLATETDLPQVDSGRVESIAVSPANIPARDVLVWLPDGYPDAAPYAVLYMHDGDMLFDASRTWNQQEWGVDEVAGTLLVDGELRPFIVVGVPNAGPERHSEYLPQAPFESFDEDEQARQLALERAPETPLFAAPVRSDAYARFLAEELKPLILERFAVSGAREDQMLMGSSMGGLISLYTLLEHPDEFGAAACLSTHWPGIFGEPNPFPAAMQAWLREQLPAPGSHRIYFDHGTVGLDALYPPLQAEVDVIMSDRGYGEGAWETYEATGADHTENDWNARLDRPLRFLFAER